MKKGAKLPFFYASTFALGLTQLTAIGSVGSAARAQSAGTAAEGGDAYSTSTFIFEKERDGKNWLLTYSFKDLQENWHRVICRIPDAESRTLERSFGLRDSEWRSVEAKYFQQALLEASPRLDYGTVSVTSTATLGSLKVQWVPAREPLNSAEGVIAEEEKAGFYLWLSKNKQSLYDKAAQKFRNERGFVLHSRLDWIPDYSGLIGKSTAAMRDCTKELNAVTGGEPKLLMKFLQSMRFVPIEVTENGKHTGGLRLPPSLMISGRGDCDSKATAFCLIHRSKSRVVIFRSLKGEGDRKHALAGVQAYPSKSTSPRAPMRGRRSTLPWVMLEERLYDADPLLIDNVYYWPCEVAGGEEGSRQPSFSEVAIGHGGAYVPIPIE
jgi:hypothetical protein